MAESNTNPYDSVVQLALQVYRNMSGTSTSDQDSDAWISTNQQPHHLCTPIEVASFLTTPWMVQESYVYLPMLSDILAWQNSSHWTRPVGYSFVLQQFKCILRPFISDHVPALCSLIFSGLSVRINTVSQPHHAFRTVVQTYAKYQRGDLCITLTEANTDHIFDVITSSLAMGDMVFMTPGGVAAFYPDLTFKEILVLNSTLNERPPGTKHVGCMKHTYYKVYNSTRFLQEPCSHICPALWCNIMDGGQGGLVLEWDSRYSIKSSMACLHTSWRLAEHCNNGLCSYLHYLRLLIKGLCKSRKHTITWRTANWELHGAGCTRTQTYFLHWVNCLGDNKFKINMAHLCKTYNVIALSSSPAYGYGYTFFREHLSLFAPPNALIEDIIADGCFGNVVMGNVLVIKHINGKKHEIVNLTIADLDLTSGTPNSGHDRDNIGRFINCPSSNGDIMYASSSNQHTPTLFKTHDKQNSILQFRWHGAIGGVALELLNGQHNNQGRVYSDSNGLEEFDEFGMIDLVMM
ncbi:hypothetical protein F4604DRAFT_1681211 [Suillus subluteus]|nr:hypothetical protein F4604DRAFT_1681211 [Suillus subluteus]